MRIIAGTARGRRLATPKDTAVRPTTDRVREALFSILTSRRESLAGSRVLDLFAGTGALGIEALSRGASQAVFVDSRHASLRLVEKNLALTGLSAASRAVAMDARQALPFLARQGARFDLVFCDPPYRDLDVRDQVLAALGSGELLAPDAIIIMEGAARDPVPETVGLLHRDDGRTYGDTAITFFTLTTGE